MAMSKKRIWVSVLAVVLIVCMAIGGTMAYLTDNDSATNTFTFGSVAITLSESNWDANNAKNVVPNQVIAKNPVITNSGDNDAIVFLSVTIPMENVTVAGTDGTKGSKVKQEIFTMNSVDSNWILVSHDESTGEYVYGYKTSIAKSAATNALFTGVTVKNILEGEITGSKDIVVNAYAIQADNIQGVTYTKTALTKDTLSSIYDIYVAQNTQAETELQTPAETITNDRAT